jgi:hypothetical protein
MQSLAGGICSETSNECSVGASATTSDCLIETLASGVFGVIGSEDGLAR